MCLSSTVNAIFNVKYWRDLEIWVTGHWMSLEMAPFDRSQTSSYSSFIVTMAVSCTVFEIKRDICRKCQFFIHLAFNLHGSLELLRIFAQILTQTVRFPELLGGAQILTYVRLKIVDILQNAASHVITEDGWITLDQKHHWNMNTDRHTRGITYHNTQKSNYY